MKETIIKYGIIAGFVLAIFMAISTFLFDKIGYSYAVSIDYGGTVAGFLPILLGARKFRDELNDGALGFGKGFVICLLMVLLANIFYLVAWLIIYYNKQGFMDGFTNYALQQMKTAGASQKEMNEYMQEVSEIKEAYSNPWINSFYTYTKLIPRGIFFSLICGLILRRKPSSGLLQQQQ